MKVKVFRVYALKACKGSGVIAPLILNLGTKCAVSGQPHTEAALLPGKEQPGRND